MSTPPRLLVLLLVLPGVAPATAPRPAALQPNLFWCSWAGPNQTLTIGGANLSAATEATIAALPRGSPLGTSVPVGPSLQLSASVAQLVVPAQLPHGAYEVTIMGSRIWAPGRIVFPPPEKHELELSFEMGCTHTVPFSKRTKHPVLTRHNLEPLFIPPGHDQRR